MSYQVFNYPGLFTLESGSTITGLQLAYTSFGQLNAARDNVVWVFHALTANSNPAEWWPGLVGEGKYFDPAQYFIICVNTPGGCYGSTGPLHINPETGVPYYYDFPFFTTRDMVRAYQSLREALGITRIHTGIGGSMGGMQLLEWAIEEPERFVHIIPIATNARHSPWGIAFNATQRMSIEADSTWKEKHPQAGSNGLKAARAAALLSYRHYNTYLQTQQEENDERLLQFNSDSYQRYQGEKLANRFNALSYYILSQSMDAHHTGRGRGSLAAALQRISARTLVIGISSDVLYPLAEQEFLAQQIPNASLVVLESLYGHDGFLLEYEQITRLLEAFLPPKPRAVKETTIT
jgi:homoserine O-acetyltransferase/O-succinyltransferase